MLGGRPDDCSSVLESWKNRLSAAPTWNSLDHQPKMKLLSVVAGCAAFRGSPLKRRSVRLSSAATLEVEGAVVDVVGADLPYPNDDKHGFDFGPSVQYWAEYVPPATSGRAASAEETSRQLGRNISERGDAFHDAGEFRGNREEQSINRSSRVGNSVVDAAAVRGAAVQTDPFEANSAVDAVEGLR